MNNNTTNEEKNASEKVVKKSEMIWGAAGKEFSVISNWFTRFAWKLNVTDGEFRVLSILTSYYIREGELPHPSIKTLCMNRYGAYDENKKRSMNFTLENLEGKALIKRKVRFSGESQLPNYYDLSPLVEKLVQIRAEEKAKEEQKENSTSSGGVNQLQGGDVNGLHGGSVNSFHPGGVNEHHPIKKSRKRGFEKEEEKKEDVLKNVEESGIPDPSRKSIPFESINFDLKESIRKQMTASFMEIDWIDEKIVRFINGYYKNEILAMKLDHTNQKRTVNAYIKTCITGLSKFGTPDQVIAYIREEMITYLEGLDKLLKQLASS